MDEAADTPHAPMARPPVPMKGHARSNSDGGGCGWAAPLSAVRLALQSGARHSRGECRGTTKTAQDCAVAQGPAEAWAEQRGLSTTRHGAVQRKMCSSQWGSCILQHLISKSCSEGKTAMLPAAQRCHNSRNPACQLEMVACTMVSLISRSLVSPASLSQPLATTLTESGFHMLNAS